MYHMIDFHFSPHSLHLLLLLLLLLLLVFGSFLYLHYLIIFHWSLSDNKSQFSWTLLTVLVDLNNPVVWMILARPPISNSSSPLMKPLGIVPSAPITTSCSLAFLVLWQGLNTCLTFHFLLCSLYELLLLFYFLWVFNTSLNW